MDESAPHPATPLELPSGDLADSKKAEDFATTRTRFVPFRFTGSGREYFRIWIVNLFLTLITLGIYSAWAKVRKKRYFYGHTWLAGSNFDYHGQPIAILKGRLIAGALFAAYWAASHFIPRLGTALLLALILLAPWFIVRSMAFNAHYSSYRNLRFGFRADYLDGFRAIWPLVLVPIVTLLLPELDPEDLKTSPKDLWTAFVPLSIFALVYPYAAGSLKLLHINRSRYGTAPLACSAKVPGFYWIWFEGLCVALVGAMFLGFVAIVFLRVPVMGIVFTVLAYVMMMTAVVAYTRSRTTNMVFGATQIDRRMQFISELSATKLAKIYFVNSLAIVISCGLLIPWAIVRVARYRAEALHLVTDIELDEYLSDLSRSVAATGEEMGEMFDIDLSL